MVPLDKSKTLLLLVQPQLSALNNLHGVVTSAYLFNHLFSLRFEIQLFALQWAEQEPCNVS